MDGSRSNVAFGAPGITPRWTSGAKDGVGTAYCVASKVWFTVVKGCLTEIYYPTIDTPQVRDLQFLITDGETFFHEERRALIPHVHPLENGALGVSVTMADPEGRYQLRKQIITDCFEDTLLIHTTIDASEQWLRKLRVYVLCAPHLNIGGAHNNGEVIFAQDRCLLTAFRDNCHLALASSLPFSRASVGYVGSSDGWQDLADDLHMGWAFDYAPDGNIALTGELDIRTSRTFTVALSFGSTRQSAVTSIFQSLSQPFDKLRKSFVENWEATHRRVESDRGETKHDHHLYATSINLVLAHEDKTYPGAIIASLSIPWGELKGDEELGGYHLVWSRDLCQSATSLLAADDRTTPLRSLIYLAVAQRQDGSFYQNFWIDGRPYWKGLQLDEVAFPVILAWRLKQAGALAHFDPHSMVRLAVSFILREGPLTRQDRWEEAAGYSPSTLAAVIAGLICGAQFAREAYDDETAEFIEDYADFLRANLERWCVTSEGTLLPGITRHYIRINPVAFDDDGYSTEDPNQGTLRLANQAPGAQFDYPAREIVDAGFLELVRYGILRGQDPVVEESLQVVDAALKVETPQGPCWRRYNHDGYGQRADGSGFDGWGVGRAWPLLTGERAHYELAAGRADEALRLLKTYERFANGAGMLPEQIWDEPDSPNSHMQFGSPTGAAIPLVWAHAEYVKLVQSLARGFPVDRIKPVYERYSEGAAPWQKIDVWSKNRHPRHVIRGTMLRFIFEEDFMLRWSADGWTSVHDIDARRNALELHFADIPVGETDEPLSFTLFWKGTGKWEGRNYSVSPVSSPVVAALAAGNPMR